MSDSQAGKEVRKKIKGTDEVAPPKILEALAKCKVSEQPISRVRWTEPETLVVGQLGHAISLFDVVSKKTKQILTTRDSAVMSVDALSSQLILSGHEDGFVRLWDLRTDSGRP